MFLHVSHPTTALRRSAVRHRYDRQPNLVSLPNPGLESLARQHPTAPMEHVYRIPATEEDLMIHVQSAMNVTRVSIVLRVSARATVPLRSKNLRHVS